MSLENNTSLNGQMYSEKIESNKERDLVGDDIYGEMMYQRERNRVGIIYSADIREGKYECRF